MNRIDNAGNYCAAKCGGLCGHVESNCNWATPTTQTLNREHIRQFTAAETQDIVDSVAIGRSQEWLARKYAVGRRVIRRVLRDAWRAANGVDLTRVDGDPVTVIIKAIRREGFPQPTDELDPITRVRRSKTTIIGDTIVGTGRAGQRTCLVAHPHRFKARHNGQPSVVEAFNDDALLARAIRYQLDCGDPTTPSRVLRALQAFVRAPQNFPPALARGLVDEYAPENGTVLDPCAGFGGRLLGTVASTKNLRYVGFDIEARTVDGNNTLAKRLGVSDRVSVTLRDAVSLEPWPRADLVITSPPYFNLEDYGDAARAALPTTYEAWRDGFLRALIANALRAAPVVVLNVANAGKRDLPADAAAIAVSLGGVVTREITWLLPKFGRSQRAEKILVIRAPTSALALSEVGA